MTRFIWDKFSKDLIETLLSPYGQVNPSKEVASEVKKIDLWFTPNAPDLPDSLGLLGKLSQTPCLIEPYRNAINQDDILDCLHRQLTVRGLLRRKAKREGRRLSKDEIPFVWIVTYPRVQRGLPLSYAVASTKQSLVLVLHSIRRFYSSEDGTYWRTVFTVPRQTPSCPQGYI